MAKLKPNAKATMLGVTVNEKIIPDGTKWKNATKAKAAGSSAGVLYKKQKKLCGGTGEVKKVTVHNTNDLENVHDDAEQYTRATYNENMGLSRVHYYIDDVGAWQNLKAGTGLFAADPVGSAEVSWHAGDGSTVDGGNSTSLSLEIIMNDNPEHDAKAYDNGARVAAWLLYKHGLSLDDLVTHTYWVNKSAGKSFADVDEQCTSRVSGKKWCPAYIFGSTNHATALKNWKAFKAVVKGYLDELNGVKTESTKTPKITVLDFQKAAIADGFKFPKYGADGAWGGECESVAKNAVVMKRVFYKYRNLTKLVQKIVGFVGDDVDGKCGKATKAAIEKWQAEHGFVGKEKDGKWGVACWKAYFNK